MDWIPYGPHAALIRFGTRIGDRSFQQGRAILAALDRNPPPGLVALVPAFTSVLLEFDPLEAPYLKLTMNALMQRLKSSASPAPRPRTPIEIPVIYDGPDLELVAERSRLSVPDVCALHAEPVYKVYMLGFSPGFPYLGDLNRQLHTPRRESPRKRVPAGAVAIGGEHTGIYSVSGPGGWHIIGHTSVALVDPGRLDEGGSPQDAFLFAAGDLVRFVPKKA